jgi:hypothetical protein
MRHQQLSLQCSHLSMLSTHSLASGYLAASSTFLLRDGGETMLDCISSISFSNETLDIEALNLNHQDHQDAPANRKP